MNDEPTPRGGRKIRTRILLVEDHPLTAETLRRLLVADGFDVRVAGSYREALAAATQLVPDIVVCDIGLPDGRDGTELIRTMRRAHPGLCAIAVSGHTEADHVARSRAAGFVKFLPKPITIDRLTAAIGEVLAGGSCERPRQW